MEDDTSELFNTEALSFDSTLDSLMDVDYVPDEKALPFSPPSFNPPSEVLMSAQNSFRADISHNDGGSSEVTEAGMPSESILEIKEDRKTVVKEQSKDGKVCKGDARKPDSKDCVTEDTAKVNDQTMQIDIEVKERVRNDLREPSPNFDQIKAKRKKNLAKKKPTSKAVVNSTKNKNDNDKESGTVSTCPYSAKTVVDPNINEKNLESEKEPPLKKMRISEEVNVCKKPRTTKKDKCVNDSDGLGKEVNLCQTESGNNESKNGHVSISKIELEISKSDPEVQDTVVVSNAQDKIDTTGELERNMGIDEDKESMLNNESNSIEKIKDDTEMNNENKEESISDYQKNQHEQSTEAVTEENDFTERELSTVREEMEFDDEQEDEQEDEYVNNDMEYDRESDMDDINDNDEDEKQDEKEDFEGDDYDVDEFDDEDDVDDDEIHNWLEEGLTKEEIREKRKEDLKEGEFISNEKYILKVKGENPFEILPKGWISISHNCGMPAYLHKDSRVCTFSRPYFIGSGSIRKHDIPLSSIPCLQYRREKEKEKAQEQEIAENVTKETNGDADDEKSSTEPSEKELLPKPVIKKADENDKVVHLAPKELNKYCQGLFNFRVVTVRKFKTWREKRAHMVAEKKKRAEVTTGLAPETKLITCPIPPEFTNKKTKKKEFVLNPEGKTAVSILHEYTQNVLRIQPTYEFKEMANAELPFQATVIINGMQYGSGLATGKRQAKNEGAKATLEILVPELAELWNENTSNVKQKNELTSDLKFFETISIEDPRVPELCVKSSLPQPYQVLHTCLQRNYGLGDTTFKVDKKMISNQKTEFTLSVGKRTCTVVCKNKREAKQRAAQSMLQQLHPLLKNWAAILRLYSRNTEVGFEEKQDEFPEQVFRQEKKKNFEILGKLKSAMRKVRDQRKNFSDGNTATVPPQQPATLDL